MMQSDSPRRRGGYLRQVALVGSLLLWCCFLGADAADYNTNPTCRRELDNANRSLSLWADKMESMVNESKLPSGVRDQVHNEANKVLDAIEDYGANIERLPASQLAKELVEMRKRANRLALEVYLHTFDMGWPSSSLQLGVIVERVQQACLDRRSVWSLESAPGPLNELLELVARAANETTTNETSTKTPVGGAHKETGTRTN